MKQIMQALVTGVCLLGCNAFAEERTERVRLDDGTTTIQGEIKGNDSVQYSLKAKPNRELTIRLRTSNSSNYINVEQDGSDEAVCQGAMSGNVCSVGTDRYSDYVVDVFLMRNAARRGEKAKYTLSIEQSAPQSANSSLSGRAEKRAERKAASKEDADDAVAACKSALALKSGVNAVFVLPVSHVPAAGGYEVFLNLRGAQWLCTTDSRGNVNRMEAR